MSFESENHRLRTLTMNRDEHPGDVLKRARLACHETDLLLVFPDFEMEIKKGEYTEEDLLQKYLAAKSVYLDKVLKPLSKEVLDQQVTEVMSGLEAINFSSTSEILEWCIAFANASDFTAHQEESVEIIKKFLAKGLDLSINRKAVINMNREERMQLLIADFIDQLSKLFAVHPAWMGRVDRFKQDFQN